MADILKLFAWNILYVALPAIISGCIVTRFVSAKWMENFSEQWHLSFGEFTTCAFALLVLIEVVVILNCLKIANQNPVDSLKKE